MKFRLAMININYIRYMKNKIMNKWDNEKKESESLSQLY